jgi:hypothetical protein
VVRIHSGVPHSKRVIVPPKNSEYTTGTQQDSVVGFLVTVRCLPAPFRIAPIAAFGWAGKQANLDKPRTAEWRYRIGFADAFTLAGALAFLRISASSATAALFTDSGMLC